jgi:hypothetical protein
MPQSAVGTGRAGTRGRVGTFLASTHRAHPALMMHADIQCILMVQSMSLRVPFWASSLLLSYVRTCAKTLLSTMCGLLCSRSKFWAKLAKCGVMAETRSS